MRSPTGRRDSTLRCKCSNPPVDAGADELMSGGWAKPLSMLPMAQVRRAKPVRHTRFLDHVRRLGLAA